MDHEVPIDPNQVKAIPNDLTHISAIKADGANTFIKDLKVPKIHSIIKNGCIALCEKKCEKDPDPENIGQTIEQCKQSCHSQDSLNACLELPRFSGRVEA